MAPIDPRDFGRLEAEVQAMLKQIEEMASDMKAVRTMLDGAAGGWRVMVAVASFTSAMTALAMKLIPFWPFK
jgi:hypothetical protein